MKKLIKADLTGVLKLVPVYQAVTETSVEQALAELYRCEQSDYLFWSRREKCRLFDLPSVYTPDSYANLTWTYGTLTPRTPVTALYLHITNTVEGRPWGSVTLLDYPTTAQDVEIFSALPEPERARHIELIRKRCTRNVRYCTILEVIQYLKTGR